ncbi:MAG: cytochrome C [Lutibacter sp.]|nr:MAG: cytochrome C [Lutibacter sp.]
MKRKILLFLLIIFIGIQFIPVELNQSEITSNNDFIAATNPSKEIETLLKTSCYDCHSNNTNYPWYDRVAPVSFWVRQHIDEAKDELNFSEWNTYTQKRKNHKIKEIIEETEEGEMPLESYLIMHVDAKLSIIQIEQLKNWLDTIKAE